MFVRVKQLEANGRRYRYLHVVENYRDNGRVRQRIVASLGRLDDLLASGDLERLIRQLIEQCPSVKLMKAEAEGRLEAESDKLWGPILIFERLWEELGLKALLPKLAARTRLTFDFERMVFVQAIQRLLAPGSDLLGSKWIATIEGQGFDRLRLQHFYRSLRLLWQKKEAIEEALYRRGLDLFNQELDLVFFDTTSTYFEGTSLKGFAELGKSKDHRPDHLQLVIGVVMRKDGLPIACEIWPGNTADVTTVKPVIESLRKRFAIKKVVFVADRGMVSDENLKALDAAGYEFIVGMKMRGSKEVKTEVLCRAGRYRAVAENLEVKEVLVDDRRYVICFNPEEAAKDRHDREALLAKLETKLKDGGVKNLINNRGYRRFLKVASGSVTIDTRRAQVDARYDGKYVLRTTTTLPAAEVAQAYKQLTFIERLWRELKDVMRLRPIYHWQQRDNVKGHIFACFLALYLVARLKQKLAAEGLKLPWDEIVRDLSQVRAVVVRLDGKPHRLRTPLQGHAGRIFQVVGVKPPPIAEAIG